MSAELRVLHLAVVTLQTTTPLSTGTGVEDALFDTLLARDANGLPIIPGTSIAGVLRHLYLARNGRDATNALFGLDAEEIRHRAKRDQAGQKVEASYEASSLQVSHAALHGQNDLPASPGLQDPSDLARDPLYEHALRVQPIARDHVKLTHRGVADVEDRGKFTRAALARGNRFSFELALWSAVTDDPRWSALADLLARPEFRLGGATRRGYGGVAVLRWRERIFDLANRGDAEAYRAHYSSGWRGRYADFDERAVAEPAAAVSATLRLTAEDFFRFGAGRRSFAENASGKPPDMLPASEPLVSWVADPDGGECGTIEQDRALVPASAIKGAIAHRLAFHYNRLDNRFLEDGADPSAENPAVTALFGVVRRDSGGEEHGQAGRVPISDLLLELAPREQVGRMPHNGLDRFTGGTRRGVLYSEELLYRCSFTVILTILDPDTAALASARIREAFGHALDDLAEGRLALGAGSSKGHGRFNAGDGIVWSDGGNWIAGGVA